MLQMSRPDGSLTLLLSRAVFTEVNVEEHSVWSEVKVQIADREATMAVTEPQAEKMFR